MNNSSAIPARARALPHTLIMTARQIGRSALFLGTAGRVAAGYLRAQRRAKRLPSDQADALWQAEHRRQAQTVARVITRMRGMLIKSGQYMSARPDVLPEAYVEALAGLQDAVPPR